MATWKEYFVRYHHGRTLVKERDVSYINGYVVEFVIDPVRICYWIIGRHQGVTL